MIQSFLEFLGVSPTPLLEAVSVALIGSFVLALTYKLMDFLIGLVTALVGRDKNIKL